MFSALMGGFANALQPINLMMLFAAVVLGFFAGAMPGVSGITLIVILLPITYGMDPVPVFVLLSGIYLAQTYSGSIAAILYRIPGTPEAVCTVFDGYAMSQQGKTSEALGLAMTSSAIGGTAGAILLCFLAQPLSNVALRFSSPEYFALAVMGLTLVATLSGKNIIRGLIAALFGLFIATVGIDPISGVSRFTFGWPYLMMGFGLVPFMTGLFGISEVLKNCRKGVSGLGGAKKEKIRTKLFSYSLLKQCIPTIAYSTLLGSIVGILPGVGGTTAAVLSYSENMRISKNPEKFGTGCPEGIAAPETANNVAAALSFVPVISLGIPGSATTAIIMGAFILHGLQPGPLMITKEPVLVYTIFAALVLINIMMLIVCKPFISAFSRTQNIPYHFMAPIILVFCFIGTYSVRNSMYDVWVMMFFGLLGYLFDRINFPLAPIILGVVLGTLAESEMRRALLMSRGSFSIFVTRPICLALLLVSVASIVFAFYKNYAAKAKEAKANG